MLSLSEFACLVSKQHYRFLLQSLNDLEHQIEQHRAERHLMELHITNLQQQTTQWCPDAMSTSSTRQTPSLLSDIESEPHRRSFNNHEPPSNPSSHNTTRRSIKAKIRYRTPEWPTWDREGTQSMTRYDVRDVGRKDILLGIVTKNINMMGSNTSQLSGKRIWWNQHMLLTGTRTPKTSSKAVVVHRKNHYPPPLQIPFSCHLSVQTQVPLIPNRTQRRQPFLIDHLPLGGLYTPPRIPLGLHSDF